MFDYTDAFTVGGGDFQIAIGGYDPAYTPPYSGTVTNPPVYYANTQTNQTQQMLMLGLIVLAVVLLTRK